MSRGYNSKIKDILAVLMNNVNNDVLALLSTGEYNTREIARILGRDEGDISRRLNRMKKLGLVESRWTRIGDRNVKLYRLKSRKLVIRFDSKGINYTMDSVDEGVIRHQIDFSPKPPRSKTFIGRERELKILSDENHHLVLIVGLPGVGKTSLALKYYEDYGGSPKYWYSMSELDYLNFFVKKLALYLSSQGYRKLVDYISNGKIEVAEAANYIVDGINKLSLILVIDDYQKCKDRVLRDLIAHVASSIVNGKLIVISRTVPPELSSIKNLAKIQLKGLDYTSAYKLLKTLGVKVNSRIFTEIYIATQGHPGLLTLVARIAFSEGLEKTMNMLLQGNISKRLWEIIYSYLNIREKELLKTLLCFNEPIRRETLEKVHGIRDVSRSLYMLLDKGLIREIEGSYIVIDLIRNLALSIRDSGLCKHYYRLMGDYYLSQKGIEEFFKALKYYTLARHPKGIVSAIKYRIRHLSYRILDYIRIYEALLNEARRTIKDYITIGYIDYELGLVYLNKGLYAKAKQFLDNSLKILSDVEDHEIIGFIKAKQPILVEGGLLAVEEALKHAQEALKIAKGFKDPIRAEIEYDVYANLTRLYAAIGDLDKALSSVTREVEVSRRCNDPFYNAIARFHLAIVKQLKGSDKSSLEDLMESYSLFKISGLKDFAAKAAMTLVEVLFNEGRYNELLSYAKEAVDTFKSTHDWSCLCEIYPYYLLSLRVLGHKDKALRLSIEAFNTCKDLDIREAKNVILVHYALLALEGEDTSSKIKEVFENARESIDKHIVDRIVKLLEDSGLHELKEKISLQAKQNYSSTTLAP